MDKLKSGFINSYWIFRLLSCISDKNLDGLKFHLKEIYSSREKFLLNSEFFIGDSEIPNFSEKEDKRGSVTKKKVEKRSCLKKRTTSLF